MKRKLIIVLALVVGLPALAVGGLAVYLLAVAHDPQPLETMAVERAETAPDPRAGLAVGRPFTLVSWNIQFGAGKTEPFFYEGGTRVRATQAEMDASLPAISKAIGAMSPDVLLLQELDRASARTLMIDQFPLYMKAGGFSAGTSAPYHRAAFVPKPFTDPLGEVDMHLAVMSRGPLGQAERIQLALMAENPVVQAANLKRAMLTVEIPVEGHPHPLAVATTHLSAFSRGDGTLPAQVDRIIEWIEARPEGQPWVVAGDFNLLPPGFDKSRIPEGSAALYADETNPIEKMMPTYRTAIADQLAEANGTYVAVGRKVPDRKIDYIFVGGPITVIDSAVLGDYHAVSDHLPMTATLRIGDAPAPPAEPAAPVEPAAPAEPPAQPE